jgi:thiol-disulfide isomerase/thioredoxin
MQNKLSTSWYSGVFVLTLVWLCGASAQEPKSTSLKEGDPAPPLKADRWWNGDPIAVLEKGNVYVVEFWATWCGPCLVMMPHMSELQQQYKDKNVIFIGYTAKDPNNTEAKVSEFVAKRGSKLHYRLAYSNDRSTYDAWMRAAGQTGIPCCFVVDRQGRIAFIGHPMYLGAVLPKVTSGTWTADDLATIDSIQKEVEALFASTGKPQQFLTKLAEFEKQHPELASLPFFNAPRVMSYVQIGQVEQACAAAEQILSQATQRQDAMALQSLVTVLVTPQASQHKKLAALSIPAAQSLLKINGPKDPISLLFLAEAHYANGDKAKAREVGTQALEAAANEPQLKRTIEQRIRRYDD